MNLLLIFLTGLTSGGVSCAALQGGLLLTLINNQTSKTLKSSIQTTLLFLISKLAIHIISGFAFGLVGQAVGMNLYLILAFQTLAAIYLIASALNHFNVHPIFRYTVIKPPKFALKWLKQQSVENNWFAPIFMGLMTVLIPCGVTQAMFISALSSGNAFVSAISMGVYVVGTMPLFVLIGLLPSMLTQVWQSRLHFASAVLLLIMGLSGLNGVLTVLNSPFSVSGFKNLLATLESYESGQVKGTSLPTTEKGIQKITINITSRGYEPKLQQVKVGVPVELSLKTKESYTCANYFVFPEFDITARMQPTETKVFNFIPKKTGRYNYSCSMGMYGGVIEVIN